MDMSIKKGDRVWFDPEIGYPIEGEVVDFSDCHNFISIKAVVGGESSIFRMGSMDGVYKKFDFLPEGDEDMIKLLETSEPAILWNLKTRYDQKLIYTYIGEILISINPYKTLSIYNSDTIEKYKNQEMEWLPPHLFAIGNRSFQEMRKFHRNQVVIISGESGSGKTESFKYLTNFYASLNNDSSISRLNTKAILQSTTVFESFGNAKTIFNDNASRFGKFVEMFFSGDAIVGGQITHYLLEKSRVVHQESKERNYHIFYEMLDGLDREAKHSYTLTSAKDFEFLNRGMNAKIPKKSDSKDWVKWKEAMTSFGTTDEEMDVVIRVLSAVLHIGNIKFGEENGRLKVTNTKTSETVTKLLNITEEQLVACLTVKPMEVSNETVETSLSLSQAIIQRDALAKALYSQLFEWLVKLINASMKVELPDSSVKSIAVLDIYGFEVFPFNSFEQLCINLANETLYSHFTRHVFRLEQDEYAREGLTWQEIFPPNNQAVLEVLTHRPHGIIHLLNHESSTDEGQDQNFAEKAVRVFGKHKSFEAPRMSTLEFTLTHYAGKVKYNLGGFVERNRDVVRPNIVQMLSNSRNSLLVKMLGVQSETDLHTPGEIGIRSKKQTVLASFNTSLLELQDAMNQCKPWFVRCIKPNSDKRPFNFDMKIVMNQLRYSGITEAVKIKKAGYPIRMTFEEFVERFYALLPYDKRSPQNKPSRYLIQAIAESAHGVMGEDFNIGTNKVFLKSTLSRRLTWEVQNMQEFAVKKIVSCLRSYGTRKKYLAGKKTEIKPPSVDIAVKTSHVETKSSSSVEPKREKKRSKDDFEEKRKMKRTTDVRVNSLEIPTELAYLMERFEGIPPLHTERNWISAVGRVPMIPFVKHDLPRNVDDYILPRYFKDHRINFELGFKTTPLEKPIVPKTTEELTRKSLEVFKLILRFVFDDNMTQTQEHLIGSYIVHMAMQNLELREEIYLQVMNQCVYYADEVGLKRLWLLMANLLSACKPGERIERYVIKFVSDHGIHGWNTLCQMKILSSRPQCRLFPPCTLEWKANKKSARVALPVSFIDGQTNTLDVDSFTIAEELACHALSRRSDSRHGISGWSLALQFENEVIEMGGHGYVLDPLSCVELRSDWTKIGGSAGHMFFVISRNGNTANGDDANGYDSRPGPSRLLHSGGHPAKMSIESPRANMKSTELDSWLEDVFDQALTGEQSMDGRQVQGWIHGLGDQMPTTSIPTYGAGIGMPIIGAPGIVSPGIGLPGAPLMGVDPMAQAQAAQLQSAIHQTQLQNALLQHNIQHEVLVNQYNQLHSANQKHFSTSGSTPVLNGQFDLRSPPASRQFNASTSNLSAFKPAPPKNERPSTSLNASTQSLFSSFQKSPEPSGQESRKVRRPVSRDSSMNEADALKNRARTVRIGKISWPPRVDESEKVKPIPNRLVIEKEPDPQPAPVQEPPKIKTFTAPKPKDSTDAKHFTRGEVVTSDAKPVTQVVSIPRTNSRSKVFSSSNNSVEVKSAVMRSPTSNTELSVSTAKPIDERKEITSMIRSTISMTLKSDTENNSTSVKVDRTPSTKITTSTPSPRSPSHIVTGRDVTSRPSVVRASEVPRVDVAGRAKLLADQLFLVGGDSAVTTQVHTKTTESHESKDTWFAGKTTQLLNVGPEQRHYMYTMVPWTLMVRKEIFTPDERMESPMLLDLLFSQIVFDVLKQPCIRLTSEEKLKLRSLIDTHDISVNMDSLKRQSKQVKKLFLDTAKACQFYFGRFYAAEWNNASSSYYPVNWVMVNHIGVHLVHQDDDQLKLLKTVIFTEIHTVSKVDSRLLSLTTKDNDHYDLVCHMVASLKALIDSYRQEAERMQRTSTFGVRRNESQRSEMKGIDVLHTSMHASQIRTSMNIGQNEIHGRSKTKLTPMEPVPDDIEDIIRYGMTYFKDRSRPNVEDSFRWQKAPLQIGLHPLDDPADEKLAVEAFLAILTFMHDYPMERDTTLVDYALVLLEIPMRRRIMIDEIYCQLIKQTRPVDENHPSRENLSLCWRLFELFAMFFNPSEHLRPYMMRYLQAEKTRAEFEGAVDGVLRSLEQTQRYGGRKLLPLRSELDKEINGYSAKRIQLSMPGGLKATLQLSPLTVISELIDEVCASMDVSDEMEKNEYAIFTVLTKENISSPLRREQYAFDIFTEMTIGSRPTHFYFCRTCWVAELQLRNRKPELIDLLYRQVIDDYLSGSWLIPPIGVGIMHQARDIAQLAAIQHKINNAAAMTISSKELKPLLPKGLNRFQNIRDHEWLSRSKSQLRQLMSYTSVECKAEALHILSGWFLFGAMCFQVHTGLRSTIVPDQEIYLCLCRSGVVLLQADNHKCLMTIPTNELFSYEITIDPAGPTEIELKLSNDRALRCFSNQANKIVYILNQYMKVTDDN